MILYFSGTGNSAYAAEKIGKLIGDEAINLFERIKNNDYTPVSSEKAWVITVPTYAWRIPRIVQKQLENMPLCGSKDVYFVMTCGGSIGNAAKYIKKLCKAKNMNYRGCAEIIMPENYIAMFSVPSRSEALQIIKKAQSVIDSTAQLIKENKNLPDLSVGIVGKINSSIVNNVFYPFCVHSKKFEATDKCISCGKCAQLCPLGNIQIKNGSLYGGIAVLTVWLAFAVVPSGQ